MHRIEHNVETGEVLQIELTEQEVKEFLIRQKEAEKVEKARVKAEAEKAALLARLGLTEDELKTILG
jgi:hypothetical protein